MHKIYSKLKGLKNSTSNFSGEEEPLMVQYKCTNTYFIGEEKPDYMISCNSFNTDCYEDGDEGDGGGNGPMGHLEKENIICNWREDF